MLSGSRSPPFVKEEAEALPFVKGEAEVLPFCKGEIEGIFWLLFSQLGCHKLAKTLGEIFDTIKITKSICKALIRGGNTWIRLEAIEICMAGYPFV